MQIYIDKGTGEEMPVSGVCGERDSVYVFYHHRLLVKMWLPPTPPADDDEDMHVDLTMELLYDTSSVMSPARFTTAYRYVPIMGSLVWIFGGGGGGG